MTGPTYTYDGQVWTPSPTVSDRDSFFHSAFGMRSDESKPYFDKQAKFKRMRWSAFLTYFENESMPSCLADTLKKCFSANEKYKDVSVEDKNEFDRYVFDIILSDQGVYVEEICILATLENIKIVLLSDSMLHPVTVIIPNIELLGSYSNSSERPKEVVLSFQGNVFSRLEPMRTKSDHYIKTVEDKRSEENIQELGKSSVKYEKYKKGGSAGSKGVEFQVSLVTVFFLSAIVRRLSDWRLSSENTKAGKFDDVVLECSEGDVLLQAKHRENQTKKITLEDLMSVNSKNDDFSLPKYFLSYQEIKDNFKIKSLIICTNASLHLEVSKFIKTHKACPQSMLHHENERCTFHKFETEILHTLKENVTIYFEKNLKKKDDNGIIITDEDLQDFLNRLQFYSNFPTGMDLQKVMEQLLSRMNLHRQTTYLEVYAKIMNWFQQNDGVYLNETFTKAIFFEIWRDKYWQKLEQYKVYFQHNDLNFQQSNRIVHIAADDGYFLQELKLYRALKDKEKTLYFHWNDDPVVQKQVTESFRLPSYVLLIIIWPKFEREDESTTSICEELKQILNEYKYKNVIIVTKSDNKIVPQIHDKYTITLGSVSFQDFSKDTQERLLTNRNIEFQGRCVSVEELFTNRTIEDYDKAINSELLEKIIKEEKIRVGLPLVGLDKDISRFYINRQFQREIGEGESARKECKLGTLKETLSEENIFEINEKLILISDIAGMGKSSTLTNLAITIKEKKPHLWVIRIELNDYTKILQALRKTDEKTINVMDLLNSKWTTKFTNQLETFVFILCEKVVLMLDGLDEISPDYTDLILNMLIECQKATNFAKIIVTMRPHTVSNLEERLSVKPFVLQPFSEENQVKFLTNYWAHNLQFNDRHLGRCEQYAKMLISRMSTWLKVYDGQNKFPGVPLQSRMLAEIFQENNGWTEPLDWEGCREYLGTSRAEPKLPEEFNIMRLYTMFIDKKRSVFIDKGNSNGNTIANQALDDKFNESLSNHRNLALEVILGKTKCSLFSSYRSCGKDSEDMLVNIGIVQKANEEFHFIHRTFAEYFVAESMLEELHNQIQNKNFEFQMFLFEEILLKFNYRTIFVFFDNFLSNVVDYLPSNTFHLYLYQCLKGSIYWEMRSVSNLLFKLVENGYIATLRLIFKCIDFKIITDKEVSIKKLFNTDRHFDAKKHIFGNKLNIFQYFISQGGVNIKNERTDDSLLHIATTYGHLGMVKYLISQGANTESRNSSGRTPLHVAVANKQFDIMKVLVEQGAVINSRANNGHSIPYDSIIGGKVNIISFLLESILERDKLESKNSAIPYLAAFLGRLDILVILAEEDLDVNRLLESDITLITVAVLGNQLDTVKYLIDRGADVSVKGSNGNNALHVACLEGHLDIVKFFSLELGVDVNTSNNFDKTPVNLALERGHLDTANFIAKLGGNIDVNIRYRNDRTLLHILTLTDSTDAIKFLVECVTDMDTVGDTKRTAVLSASGSGGVDSVKILVQYKAYINVRDNNGQTALHLAAQRDNLEVLTSLAQCGADVNIRDNSGFTIAHLAAWWDKLDAVKLLLNLGADVNITDSTGSTLLHTIIFDSFSRLGLENRLNIVTSDDKRMALHSTRLDLVKMLVVQYKVDIHMRDNDGRTALHLAAQQGNLNISAFLIQSGADISIGDNSGFTAMHLAAWWGEWDAVKLFLNLGVNVNIRDDKGRTLLHVIINVPYHQQHVFLAPQRRWKIGTVDGNIALLLDNKASQLDLVKILVVQYKADINIRDDGGQTALHLAVKQGYLNISQFLVECGTDINIRDNLGFTAVHLATAQRKLDIVKLLLNRGGDVNVRDVWGHTLVHIAAACDVDVADNNKTMALYSASQSGGNLDIVKLLIKYKVDIHARDNYGMTALHAAAVRGHLPISELLIKYKVDIHARDNYGMTALHIAAARGHLPISEFLVQCGADINIRDNMGRMPSHLARSNINTWKFFLKLHININGKGYSLLHLAAVMNMFNLIEFFVAEFGAAIDAVDGNKRTALHLAIENGKLEVVKELVKFKANLDVKDLQGSTPLHYAVKRGDLCILKFLVLSGADINIMDNAGLMPIHLAALWGKLDIVKWFINFGLDVDVRNSNGWTLLHLAATRNGLKNTIKFLVAECGASIDPVDDDKITPLHLASLCGKVYAVKTLVEYKANPNVKNLQGLTPLHFSVIRGHLHVLKFLVSSGADINIMDNAGLMAIHLAALWGKLDIVKWFINFGVDVDVRDSKGCTPLHLAALGDWQKTIHFLVSECNVNIDVTDNDKETAPHLASEAGKLETVRFLVENNANVHLKDGGDCTALDLAVSSGHLNIVKYLTEHSNDS